MIMYKKNNLKIIYKLYKKNYLKNNKNNNKKICWNSINNKAQYNFYLTKIKLNTNNTKIL